MPPDPVTVTVPLASPLQETIVGTPIEADTAVTSVMVTGPADVEQLLSSFTVTV